MDGGVDLPRKRIVGVTILGLGRLCSTGRMNQIRFVCVTHTLHSSYQSGKHSN